MKGRLIKYTRATGVKRDCCGHPRQTRMKGRPSWQWAGLVEETAPWVVHDLPWEGCKQGSDEYLSGSAFLFWVEMI